MHHDFIYNLNGEEFRVVIADDVVSVPYDHWSGQGYGAEISLDWMRSEGALPGSPARKRLLAELVRRALADANGRVVHDCRAFILRERRAAPRTRASASAGA